VTLRQALVEAKKRDLYFKDPRTVVPSFDANYEPKTRWLPPTELDRLVGSVIQPKRKLWVMVAAFAGGRDSEIEALQWENVHLDKGLIRIQTTKTKGQAFWRDVPILAQLRPWLEGFAQGSGPVVEPWSNVRRDLHAACDRLGPTD
jgi:integrase